MQRNNLLVGLRRLSGYPGLGLCGGPFSFAIINVSMSLVSTENGTRVTSLRTGVSTLGLSHPHITPSPTPHSHRFAMPPASYSDDPDMCKNSAPSSEREPVAADTKRLGEEPVDEHEEAFYSAVNVENSAKEKQFLAIELNGEEFKQLSEDEQTICPLLHRNEKLQMASIYMVRNLRQRNLQHLAQSKERREEFENFEANYKALVNQLHDNAKAQEALEQEKVRAKEALTEENVRAEKALTEEKIRAEKALEEEVVKAEKALDLERAKALKEAHAIKLQERANLLSEIVQAGTMRDILSKKDDKLAADRLALEAQSAELKQREQTLKDFEKRIMDGSLDIVKERKAAEDAAYERGRKHVLGRDNSKAALLQLQYEKEKGKIARDMELAENLRSKMEAYALIPQDWHLKVAQDKEIAARKAKLDAEEAAKKASPTADTTTPAPSASEKAEEQVKLDIAYRYAHSEGYYKAARLFTAAMLVDSGKLSNEQKAKWTDSSLEPLAPLKELSRDVAMPFWMGIQSGAAKMKAEFEQKVLKKK
ncbi:hypothetical protein BDV95DRAFT_593581 [Massariosphaeria phaeospora]|uniref:Uncharacterized protein n=1 Tax=Massariosphaeria phaeospora TaxID=100035 RepID=A0A7C8MED3_9PLEO|nr:hypothetical protein BDV95DRAFT_593581 [Massariosphaeria phaeospora]